MCPAELHTHPLRDRRVFIEGKVPLFESRPMQGVAAQVSKTPRAKSSLKTMSLLASFRNLSYRSAAPGQLTFREIPTFAGSPALMVPTFAGEDDASILW